VIEALAGQGRSAKACCRLLGVAPSGYFYWRTRPPSIRQLRQAQLADLVSDIHRASNGTYGTRRITAELRLGYGLTVNRKAVKAAMRRLGIHGLPQARASAADHTATPPPQPIWSPGSSLVTHRTNCGSRTSPSIRLARASYCCAVLDAHSRRVVGWSIDSRQATSLLVTSALAMAVKNRKPTTGTVVHCDHGSQFTSWAFSERIKTAGLALSMGRIGDAYDNGMMESFWARMQTELLNRKKWRTRLELANAIFEYLEVFHNRKRRHSSLGMLTPTEYETLHHHQQIAA
jgi:putative transposase